MSGRRGGGRGAGGRGDHHDEQTGDLCAERGRDRELRVVERNGQHELHAKDWLLHELHVRDRVVHELHVRNRVVHDLHVKGHA